MPKTFAFAFCADDYAMTPGVSRGILEALDAKALSATSVMTTSPHWPEWAPHLLCYSDVDVGLHLNLTLAGPLADMPILAPHGRLPSVGELIRLDRQKRLPADEIAAEIDRQCARFVDVFGRAPDHVDGHQHVQALRGIRPLLFDVLKRRGWAPRLRDSADRLDRLAFRSEPRKALALRLIGHGFSRAAGRAGFSCNDGFAGFSRFDASEDYAALFASYLRHPGPRHLVMCHPGYVDDALRRLDPVLETREQELRFLLSGDYAAVLGRAGARLHKFTAL